MYFVIRLWNVTIFIDKSFVSGMQLMVNDANIFESTFQGTLASEFPYLKEAADMRRVKFVQHELNFQSLGNLSFLSFAKSGGYNKGMYF